MSSVKQPQTETPKQCFVISPIGDPGTEVRQKADDFLEYIVKQCPAIKEYNVTRADQIGEPGRITSQVTRHIVEADLVIADVTGDNPNVYYEMALRHAVGKPIIVCAETATKLPFDTRDNRTIFYTMHSRVAASARDELAKQISAINKSGFKPDNPIADAKGVIDLASSTDAQEHGNAILLDRLNEIAARLSAIESDQKRSRLSPAFANIDRSMGSPPSLLSTASSSGIASGIVAPENQLGIALGTVNVRREK